MDVFQLMMMIIFVYRKTETFHSHIDRDDDDDKKEFIILCRQTTIK